MDKLEYGLPTCRINTTKDKNEICRIIKACDAAFEEPVSEREIYSELLQKICRYGIFAFACQEEPAAYCAFYANDSESLTAYISLIAVKPEYQRLHIGKQLLEYCLKTAVDRGMQFCALEVKKNNPSAMHFYQENGFVFWSERENSYLMRKKLTPKITSTDAQCTRT